MIEMPYIPVTAPERQMEAVELFCDHWNGPVQVSCEGKNLVMMPYNYYLEHFCTQEEREQMEREIADAVK